MANTTKTPEQIAALNAYAKMVVSYNASRSARFVRAEKRAAREEAQLARAAREARKLAATK